MDVVVLTALRDRLGVYVARLALFAVAASAPWFLNRSLTFSHRPSAMGLWREYAAYKGLMLGDGLVNYVVYSLLTWQLAQTLLWLALYVTAGSLTRMAVNYLGASKWLYRHCNG